MTRLIPTYSLKIWKANLPTPEETLLSTPETLPTSEPTEPQVSFTVQNSNLPTFTFQPYRIIYIGYVIVSGYFPTTGTVYYRTLKNGTSVASSSYSVNVNNYFTLNCFFYDVTVGDVLAVKIWSNQSDSNWSYKGFVVYYTRLILSSKNRLLYPCNLRTVGSFPILSAGNPSSIQNCHIYNMDKYLDAINSARYFEAIYPKDTYGLFRVHYGDYASSNSVAVATSPISCPSYYRVYIPYDIVVGRILIV